MTEQIDQPQPANETSSQSWYHADFNTLLLLAFLVGFVLWGVWTTLPLVAGSKTWLMDLTSSGYKLNAFHVATEQLRIKRAPMASEEDFRRKYTTFNSVLTVPLKAAPSVIYNEEAMALNVNLRPVTVKNTQGSRAVPLAAWPEDMFPHFIRHYMAVVSDHEPMRAACYRMGLPANVQDREAILQHGQVRFAFSVSPATVTRFEIIEPPAGSVRGVTQGAMLGIVIERVSVIGPGGNVIWSREIPKTPLQSSDLEC